MAQFTGGVKICKDGFILMVQHPELATDSGPMMSGLKSMAGKITCLAVWMTMLGFDPPLFLMLDLNIMLII